MQPKAFKSNQEIVQRFRNDTQLKGKAVQCGKGQVQHEHRLRLTLKVVHYVFTILYDTGSVIAMSFVLVQGDEAVAEEISLTKGKNGIYKFEVSVGEGQEVTLLPSSQEAFFDPPKLVVKANRDCAENKISFKAKRGLFIKGKIVPPVEGVLIGVVGEGTQTALTAKDGTYSVSRVARSKKHKGTFTTNV